MNIQDKGFHEELEEQHLATLDRIAAVDEEEIKRDHLLGDADDALRAEADEEEQVTETEEDLERLETGVPITNTNSEPETLGK